jgi:hypothetical protein
MVSISMIDIITVVFREELDILKLQAQSIELFCRDMDLGQIYVAINDDSLTVDEIDPRWWGSLSNCVTVIHRQSLGINYSNNGWLTQQLLKLITASHSTNDWSMVLDAKTILIQPVNLSRIFTKDGQMTWGYFPIFPVFDPARKQVSELFGIDQKQVIGPGGVPFFFHNETVRNMIKEVEVRTRERFSKWFQAVGTITEFILYSGYVQYCDGSLDNRYVNGVLNSYLACNICHSEVLQFDQKYFEMQTPKVLTASIHRRAWGELDEFQRQSYRNLLTSIGISRAQDLI